MLLSTGGTIPANATGVLVAVAGVAIAAAWTWYLFR